MPSSQRSAQSFRSSLLNLISRFAKRRVLVVGDVSLDEYVFGYPTRLSREAPIPVLEFERRTYILGGAANPARNLVTLGATTLYIGVVGDDAEGAQTRADLNEASIDATQMVVAPDRATTLKTRILAQNALRLPQQLARIDRLDRRPLDSGVESQVLAAIDQALPHVDAVLCSDYQLGLLTPLVIQTLRTACHQRGIVLTVDTQGNSHLYSGFDLFRCNDAEASAALGHPIGDGDALRTSLSELRSQLEARVVMVTRGPAGVALLDADGAYHELPAANLSEVYDTTGAGDTFIAVATLALAAGGSGYQAALLANYAAGLVVRRLGNAVVSPSELAAVVENDEAGAETTPASSHSR